MKNIRFDEVAGLLHRREISKIVVLEADDYWGKCMIHPVDYDRDHDGSPPDVVDHHGKIMTQPLDCWIRQISTWLGRRVFGEVVANHTFVSVSILGLEFQSSRNGMDYLDWEANYGATPYAEWCRHYGYNPSSLKAYSDYDHYLDGVAQMVESSPPEKVS